MSIVTPSGWSMNRRTVPPETISASTTSISGSASASRASISAWIALIQSSLYMKKSGRAPTFELRRPGLPGGTKAVVAEYHCNLDPSTLDRWTYLARMSADATASARDTVERFLTQLEGETRQVDAGEWGVTVDAGGWPLHVGIALRDGLLRAQAEVIGPGRIDPHVLLRWNRELPLIRFSHTGAGAVYVQGELPPAAVTDAALD